ncbi:MAG: nitroreductase family protein [Patescibacteria group bacterium]
MQILEAIKTRRSIRAFKEKDISEGDLDRLKEALRWAPSARNLQPRKFYFVMTEEKRKQLDSAVSQSFVCRAPLVVVACRDLEKARGEKGENLYSITDTSFSLQNLVLAACELGLGTCYIGAFNRKKVAELLDLPENLRPMLLVPVGYPAEQPSPTSRVPKEDAVTEL